jgi:hypothetical protein
VLARDLRHGREHTLVVDSAAAQLSLHHAGAVGVEVRQAVDA